jgi:hypothetical protein
LIRIWRENDRQRKLCIRSRNRSWLASL